MVIAMFSVTSLKIENIDIQVTLVPIPETTDPRKASGEVII